MRASVKRLGPWWRGLTIGAIVATVVALSAAAARATGSEDPELPDNATQLSLEQSLAADAALLAQRGGISTETLRTRLEFQSAVDELRREWPVSVSDSYAGTVMQHQGAAAGAILYFKGDAPAVVRDLVSARGLTGIKIVGGQRFTKAEMESRQHAVFDAASALGLRAIRVTSDLRTQRIKVDVEVGESTSHLRGPAQLVDALTTGTARAAKPIASEDIEVSVRSAGALGFRPEHGYGGAGIRQSASGPTWCTSGFSVRRNSDGLKGYVTAAHCEGITQMEQNNTSGGTDLVFSSPWVDEHIGTHGEVEWHYTAHDSFPEFWSSNTARRTAASRIANIDIDEGDAVCHYGRYGGYSCGYVSDPVVDFEFNWDGCGGCSMHVYDMVQVEDATSTGGDSGGPWFLGLTAYGIHFGSDGLGYRYFSKIQNAEIEFGVSVMFG